MLKAGRTRLALLVGRGSGLLRERLRRATQCAGPAADFPTGRVSGPPVPPAPHPGPLPPGFHLVWDPATRVLDDGRALLGGSPLRLLRLAPRGAAAVTRWRAGDQPRGPAERALAARLVHAGLAHPQPVAAVAAKVTVVIPVRNRPAQLRRLLAALGEAAPVIVVDDGSADPQATREIASRAGARLIRRPVSGGAAVARNTGLAHCATPLVAFVDSDCVPDPGWLERLTAHFADPTLAAVAPRILALPGPAGVLARFEAARSPLDMGPAPAVVAPGGRVSYVPSAALVVRRTAVAAGFDETMPVGEDVDLIWRLGRAGWTVRYDPAVTVRHDHRLAVGAWLRRRFDYGTSAGPLARRHGTAVAPAVVSPWTVVVLGLLAARRPGAALATTALASGLLARKMRGVPHPLPLAARLVGLGTLGSLRWLATSVSRVWWAPALTAVALTRSRRLAAGLAVAVITPPLLDWRIRRPRLDPLRWTTLALLDDAAYATGVWWGALQARTAVPLVPAVRAAPSRVTVSGAGREGR